MCVCRLLRHRLVTASDEFEAGDEITLNPVGGGGTSSVPVFGWIEQSNLSPACLVFFTDMYPTTPPVPPDYPVLWAATTNLIAPFGETLPLEVD